MSSDSLCVNTIRGLCADMVQAAKSGHPGAPVGCAPMAHALFSRFMNINPEDFTWANRDRFILSNGHASTLHYSLLHLLGIQDCSTEQLRNFRQLGSKTPGHPERGLTTGIEMTTGPLGQGVSSAVGMAIARNHLAAKFNKPDFPLLDHSIYAIVGDGCLQEGVAFESCSLAGHLGLGGLVVLYDDNNITIDGRTDVSFTEDVPTRFRALGWEVLMVKDGDSDVDGIINALEKAKTITNKPVLIDIKTTIGFASPAADSPKAHGAPFGVDGVKSLKKALGMPEEESFYVPSEVSEVYKQIGQKGQAAQQKWNEMFASYKEQYPELATEFERRLRGDLGMTTDELFEKMVNSLPSDLFSKAKATRELSHACINSISSILPEVVGGSADLAASNKTDIKGESFITNADFSARNIRFGVREHGMAAISNGMAAYGMVKPFCATFMVFAPYMFGAMRLAALSHLPVVFVLTHDSLAVGEDGATHMPIGELSQLREIPNLKVYRPSDLYETTLAYSMAFSSTTGPSVIIGSRQAITPPSMMVSEEQKAQYKPSVYLENGCIEIKSCQNPKVTVLASGSESGMVVDSLCNEEVEDRARIVSVPCLEDYLNNQEQMEKLKGIPSISIELSTPGQWYLLNKYSSNHEVFSVSTYGVSAPAAHVLKEYGFTNENVKSRVSSLI
ncbi:hypothetical protein P9112_008927 [Eukaryota sp. TZLM1-RC]